MKPNISTPRRVLLGVFISAATLLVAAPQLSYGYDESSPSAVNVDAKGVGLRGNDPVAYFTVGAPTAGKPSLSASHNGVTYFFASAANRDVFKAHPDAYAPQFGGFCAMGVSLDKKLDGDPAVWRVVDNKLYLNVNKDAQKRWLEDVPGNVSKAETEWPLIRNKAPQAL